MGCLCASPFLAIRSSSCMSLWTAVICATHPRCRCNRIVVPLLMPLCRYTGVGTARDCRIEHEHKHCGAFVTVCHLSCKSWQSNFCRMGMGLYMCCYLACGKLVVTGADSCWPAKAADSYLPVNAVLCCGNDSYMQVFKHTVEDQSTTVPLLHTE